MTRYIDADALIEIFDKDKYDHVRNEYQSGYNDGMLHAEVVADNLPNIDAVPVRHGKWTVTSVYIKCSECGESFMLIPQNYCPNCGARMDKE